MTIKEIAEMAGVSISTVSKVINKKDGGIRPETRKRIMQIVNEYHYTPYGDVLASQNRRSFMLGIVYDSDGGNDHVLPALSKSASRNSYSVVVTMGKTREEESRNFQILAAQKVDGIIWYPVKDSDFDSAAYTDKYGIPILTTDFRSRCDAGNICFDYYQLGYQMTATMIDKGHEKILCLLHIPGSRARLLSQGYRQCLRDHGLDSDGSVYSWQDYDSEPDFNLNDYTAAVCFDFFLARRLVELAEQADLSVPGDLSVAAVGGGENWQSYENISMLSRPPKDLANFAVGKLIDQIEGTPNNETFSIRFVYNHQRSIDMPKRIRSKCLMTLSPVAVETVLSLPGEEGHGPRNLVRSQSESFGGSGLRQLAVAGELGVACYPLLRLGNDPAGRRIYAGLKKGGVNVEFVSLDENCQTPQIYTILRGEKPERIYAGRGEPPFTPEELAEKRRLVKRCHFCLLQSGADMTWLEPLVRATRRYGVRTVLKLNDPEDLESLPQGGADILVIPDRAGREPAPEAVARSGAELVARIGGPEAGWSYRGKSRRAACVPCPDPDQAADELAAALACCLPANDRSQRAVDEAAGRAFEFVMKRL